ncbi:MAG TPA: hypothetical protein VFC30_00210 [Solirubrobacteraceae bacterium]|nr:hypothetical protein [Solirubrobacteraceae bacterium]
MASYGPLLIERHVKSDGRMLILYTREGPPEGASTPLEEIHEGETRQK